ncbi:MAG: prephenate dehydrogenase [Candidatus Izemoplasmatales bacterium]
MNIGIVGLGLMGGSIAQSLSKNHTIYAYDLQEDALRYAEETGIITQGYSNLSAFFQHVKVVFVCLYPRAIPAFLEEATPWIPLGTVLIEISGVKTTIQSSIHVPEEAHYDFVMTHPIAGREKIGVRYAKASIFEKANFVIVPTERNLPSSLSLVETLAQEMGFRNITKLTAKAHDDIIAYTSQLTHVLSLALVNSEPDQIDVKKFIGDSYRDLTRISMINEILWSELFLENKQALLERIDAFETYLQRYRKAIEENDIEGLKSLMVDARLKRLAIEEGNQ